MTPVKKPPPPRKPPLAVREANYALQHAVVRGEPKHVIDALRETRAKAQEAKR